MDFIARRTILLLGGFLRWLLTSWYFKKSLKLYFENEDGTEDERQSKINFIVASIFLVLLAFVIEFLSSPQPEEFRKY